MPLDDVSYQHLLPTARVSFDWRALGVFSARRRAFRVLLRRRPFRRPPKRVHAAHAYGSAHTLGTLRGDQLRLPADLLGSGADRAISSGP